MIAITQPGKPFKILGQHCIESGYYFMEAKDMIDEQIGKKLV